MRELFAFILMALIQEHQFNDSVRTPHTLIKVKF